MPNQQIEGHALIGTTHTYRSAEQGYEQYDPALDTEGGTLIIGNGHTVTVAAVFQNWNDVADLDMLYVRCHETGYGTHVTPADLNLGPLTERGVLPRVAATV